MAKINNQHDADTVASGVQGSEQSKRYPMRFSEKNITNPDFQVVSF
jgi:hypothetical protein